MITTHCRLKNLDKSGGREVLYKMRIYSEDAHQFDPVSGMMILQEVLGHLGLNADHSGEVLQSVLELMIGSMDPWKRWCFVAGIELQSQLINATVQGATQQLERRMMCISTYTIPPYRCSLKFKCFKYYRKTTFRSS